MHSDNLKGYKQTEIGEIPEEWGVRELDDICEEITDGSHGSPKEDKNGEYRIASVVNIVDNQIDIDSCKRISRSDYDFIVRNGCKPQIGDILFSKDGTVGLSFNFKQDARIVLLSSIAIIRPKKVLDSDFGAFLLKSPFVLRKITSSKRGTGLKRIIVRDLKRLQLPLPPLPEQRKIAEVLSTVDEAIQKVDEAIAKTERLKKGLMQRLLTKGIGHTKFKFSEELGCKIPEEWEVRKLGGLTKVMVGYVGPITEFYTIDGDSIPLLSTTNISEDGLKLENPKYVTLEFHSKNKKSQVFPGDIIIARHGSSGSATVIPIKLKEAHCLNVVIVRRSEIVKSEFICYLFNLKSVRDRLIGWKSGSVQGVVNTKVLENFNIPLPPLHEQKKITEILSIVDEKTSIEKRKRERLERVKKGLMNDLLTGKKRVKLNE